MRETDKLLNGLKSRGAPPEQILIYPTSVEFGLRLEEPLAEEWSQSSFPHPSLGTKVAMSEERDASETREWEKQGAWRPVESEGMPPD